MSMAYLLEVLDHVTYDGYVVNLNYDSAKAAYRCSLRRVGHQDKAEILINPAEDTMADVVRRLDEKMELLRG